MARAHPEIPGLVDWRPLARGGFSTVWQARQQSLDRLVAVKVDHRTLEEGKEQRRFLREAGAAGRLSGHPGIVTVHYAGILPDDRPYMVMDLCPGGSLTRWLKPENRQSQEKIRDVGVRIADALAAAHARGVLHRDVKPANILIDAYDNPGLADFGLAALPDGGTEFSVTLEGMTPAYAAKEVFYLKPPTEFGDVYSLAATLYALFDGKPPRWPETGTASVPELLELQRKPVERLPQVDEGLMDVLLTALDDEPENRPTAAEFRDQLAAIDFDAPILPVMTPPSHNNGQTRPAVALLSADVDRGDSETGSDSDWPVVDRPSDELGQRRRWLRLGFLAAAAVAIVGVAVVAILDLGSPTGNGSTPPAPAPITTTSGASASPGTPSPSNTPTSHKSVKVPAGFSDCSKQLGGTSYCLTEPECWGSVISLSDIPLLGTMQDCDKAHNYQTFAAGQLRYVVRRQSQLTADKQVRKVCSKAALNKMLPSGRVLKDWEIFPLPPQINFNDNIYRCLFGNGQRSSAVRLKTPT